MVKLKKESKNVRMLAVGFIIALVFLFGTNPPARNNLLTYILFFGLSFFIYGLPSVQKHIIGISQKNLGRSIGFGFLAGGGYYLLAKIVPGLSLGLPILPNAIGDGLTFFLVVVVASVGEELAFRGGLLAYIRIFKPTKKNITLAIILQGVLFGLAHVGSYIVGFYNYPNLPAGLTAFGANIGAFMIATTFGILAGYFVTRDGIKNLAFAIIFHSLLNLIIFTSLAIIVINVLLSLII